MQHQHSPKDLMDADRQVGHAIAVVRRAKGISQTDLGQACGVSFQQVHKYETGRSRIGAGRLQAIAEHLGVPVSDLVGAPEAPTSTGISLQQMQQPYVLDLLNAFAGITEPVTRHLVVEVVRAVARPAVQPLVVQ